MSSQQHSVGFDFTGPGSEPVSMEGITSIKEFVFTCRDAFVKTHNWAPAMSYQQIATKVFGSMIERIVFCHSNDHIDFYLRFFERVQHEVVKACPDMFLRESLIPLFNPDDERQIIREMFCLHDGSKDFDLPVPLPPVIEKPEIMEGTTTADEKWRKEYEEGLAELERYENDVAFLNGLHKEARAEYELAKKDDDEGRMYATANTTNELIMEIAKARKKVDGALKLLDRKAEEVNSSRMIHGVRASNYRIHRPWPTSTECALAPAECEIPPTAHKPQSSRSKRVAPVANMINPNNDPNAKQKAVKMVEAELAARDNGTHGHLLQNPKRRPKKKAKKNNQNQSSHGNQAESARDVAAEESGSAEPCQCQHVFTPMIGRAAVEGGGEGNQGTPGYMEAEKIAIAFAQQLGNLQIGEKFTLAVAKESGESKDKQKISVAIAKGRNEPKDGSTEENATVVKSMELPVPESGPRDSTEDERLDEMSSTLIAMLRKNEKESSSQGGYPVPVDLIDLYGAEDDLPRAKDKGKATVNDPEPVTTLEPATSTRKPKRQSGARTPISGVPVRMGYCRSFLSVASVVPDAAAAVTVEPVVANTNVANTNVANTNTNTNTNVDDDIYDSDDSSVHLEYSAIPAATKADWFVFTAGL